MTSLIRSTASLIFVCTLLCSATSRAAAPETEPELMFAGLFVNDEEQDGADLYLDGEDYWLPLDQLRRWTQIEVVEAHGNTSISTPLGDADIAPHYIRKMPEGQHINMLALQDIGIHAHFEQSTYALVLYAPWIGMEPQTAALMNSPREPDYYPLQAGIARLYNRLDSSYQSGHSQTGLYTDALGYLANGVWGLQTTTNTNLENTQETELSQLHWSTFDRYVAMRLGTTKANPGPLLEAPDFTGLQLGYSNLSVYNHLASSTSVTRQMFIDDAAYSYDISGDGPKGGIAELRVNDRPIARVRIALDGRFLFRRLPVAQGNTDRVEVAIYEYSLAQPPVDIIDYSIASKPRAVSTGEVMLNAGVGTQGDSFDSSVETGDTTSYGSLRYGVSNFLTLEAATQQQSDRDNGFYLGAITSIGGHFATSIGSARTGDVENNGAEIWLSYPNLKANYKGNKERDKDSDESEENQDLSASWKIHNNFSLLARGLVRSVNGETSEEYLAPGFDWRINTHSTLSVQPIAEHEYDARYTLRSAQRDAVLQLRASRDAYGVGLNYAYNNALSLGADYSVYEESDVLSAAANYRPRHNNDSIYSAQISQQNKRLGYSLGWQHRLSKHTQFNFSYYRQLADDDALLESVTVNDNESLSLSIESELWLSSRGGWRSASFQTDSTHGAVSARLLDAEGQPLQNEGIRLHVEGAQATLNPSDNGEQSIAGLPPGDYNLKVLAEGLPIEYENNSSNYRIRVAPAATTHVDITMLPHYGVSGLLTVDNQPAAHTWVDVWQGDTRVAETKTDSYGYYQATGLEPGSYQLRYAYSQQDFELVDDYLFDVNIASASEPPITSALSEPLIDELLGPDFDSAEAPESPAENSTLNTDLDDLEKLDLIVRELAGDSMNQLGSALPAGLSGRIYQQGEPLGHVSVQLQSGGRKIATVNSDQYGYYSFHHLSPGNYRVAVGNSAKTFKVSNNRTYDADIQIDDTSVGKQQWPQP